MIHVTVLTPRSTLGQPNLSRLLTSAATIGLRTAVLTHDEIPTAYFQIYKLFLVRRFLRHLPEDEVVLFTDALDVCFVNDASPAAFLAAFERSGADVLFHAEDNMYPETLAGRVPRYAGTYPYLNTGGYLGRAGALLRILDDVLSFHRPPLARTCDQNSLWRWLIRHPDGFALDHEARVFQAAIHDQDLVLTEARVGNVHNDSAPLVLHFNGPKEVLKALERPDDPSVAALRAHVRARGWVVTPGLVESLPVVDAGAIAARGLPEGPFVYRVPYRPTGTRVLSALIGQPFVRPPSLDGDLADLTVLVAGKSLDPLRHGLKRLLTPAPTPPPSS